MSNIRFESLGLYLPSNIVSTKDLLKEAKNEIKFDLEKLTGVENRRFRSDEENCLSMAVAAAKDCFSHSKYEAKDLDIIINTSITRLIDKRHYFEPSMSFRIKKEIGARKSAINFDISNACSGMFTGAYILHNMIKNGFIKRGMVVSGESFSDIAKTALLEISEKIDMQFASLTFGDSGAAFIIDGDGDINEGIDVIDFVTVASFADLCIGMPSLKNPGLAIYTNTKVIHEENIIRWPLFIDTVFKKNGKNLSFNDFDFIVTHQTSIHAIHAFLSMGEEYFKTSMPPALYSVKDFGNTTSTTHFVALYNCIKEKKIKPNTTGLLVSNASGIQIGCFVLKIGNMNL